RGLMFSLPRFPSTPSACSFPVPHENPPPAAALARPSVEPGEGIRGASSSVTMPSGARQSGVARSREENTMSEQVIPLVLGFCDLLLAVAVNRRFKDGRDILWAWVVLLGFLAVISIAC